MLSISSVLSNARIAACAQARWGVLRCFWAAPVANVVELALQRYEFNVKPIAREVAADQQRIADAFHALKWIPKPIQVGEAVVFALD
ncbi:hypothetical protein [Diaphorobacter ruginosibacter]|uniref:hypothetical protein n=1 Tax=Diaphorobacter ruginosibacter TaxID=1715720 RepID=UPI001FE70651|nr:hypothetical protein [Diaphorobacter ruginosibacter]